MANKDLLRLKHMLDSINAILEFVRDKNRVNLSESRLLSSAIARELEILSEAAGRVLRKPKIDILKFLGGKSLECGID